MQNEELILHLVFTSNFYKSRFSLNFPVEAPESRERYYGLIKKRQDERKG